MQFVSVLVEKLLCKTGFISLQRPSGSCHFHCVMDFASSFTTHSQKASYKGWSLWEKGNAILLKQIPWLLKILPAITSPHVRPVSDCATLVLFRGFHRQRRKTQIYSRDQPDRCKIIPGPQFVTPYLTWPLKYFLQQNMSEIVKCELSKRFRNFAVRPTNSLGPSVDITQLQRGWADFQYI
jgi:hypothetical protein